MWIKETPWERRNLGVESSVEYYFELSDNAAALDPTMMHDEKNAYQVAHIPVGRTDIVNELIKHGFSFSETKFQLTADLRHNTLSDRFSRYIDSFNYHLADAEETELIYEKIREGIFSLDKIALDPHFDAHISGNRYVLWTNDVLEAGNSWLYIVKEENEAIGFFVLTRMNESIGESFLAGLFDKARTSGIGFSVLYFPMAEVKKLGMKKLLTGISSNNPDSLKVHLALGYQLKSMEYVLVKHI